MTAELLRRLAPWYDETYAAKVMHPKTGKPKWSKKATFGDILTDIRSIVVHQTVGWPRREKADDFVNRYLCKSSPYGEGPQFYISGDGTAARLIDVNRLTAHASYVNDFTLAVEMGNLFTNTAPPNGKIDPDGKFGPLGKVLAWKEASPSPGELPGLKLWIAIDLHWHPEVVASWYTTSSYDGPGRTDAVAGTMQFSEWQYRTLALLGRYLLELQGLPRNFPVLPHQREFKSRRADAAGAFRHLVLADERADMLKAAFVAAPISIPAASFASDDALQTPYDQAFEAQNGDLLAHNLAWRKFIDMFRGVYGHHFCGNSEGSSKGDCPGPLFDFHRLAREIWDYWWYPFDVVGTSTKVEPRGYRRFNETTPLVEYYFEENEVTRIIRKTTGIHGARSSPDTFVLDPQSPVYAMANGDLVAARFPLPTSPLPHVSMAFALVRHEIYHLRRLPNVVLGPIDEPISGLIDFNRPPATVYTLYMHLGRPDGMSFDEVTAHNPDWLNRVIARKIEAGLGTAFYDADPTHNDIPDDAWVNQPRDVPGHVRRPSTLGAWRADKGQLTDFLTKLRAGAVAAVPVQPWVQPIRVLLGDFLGQSGVIRSQAGTVTHGIRVEAFSPSFVAPTFAHVTGQTGWNLPGGTGVPPCVTYLSEWARPPTAAELAEFANIGVDPALVPWWGSAATGQLPDLTLRADARLPFDGPVVHYRPLDFARWINQVTWQHEWPKYQVTPATPAPPQPRPRRM